MLKLSRLVASFCAIGFLASSLWAAKPAAELLPNTTKGFLSTPNVDELKAKFNESQIGLLIADPIMKPFVEDLQRQIGAKVNQSRLKVGLSWDDLKEIYAGEVAIAAVQPANDPKQHAQVLLCDATGKGAAANAAIEKAAANLVSQGAVRSKLTASGIEINVLSLPKRDGEAAGRKVFIFLHADQLVSCNHQATVEGIAAALVGENKASLASVPAYAEPMKKLAEAAGALKPHVRWFVDPFGYIEVTRAAQGGKKKRGQDLHKILGSQGFRCIQSLAGYVNFTTSDHDILHRSFVYAPGIPRSADAKNKDKYDLAARMLNFPNSTENAPQKWIPRDLSTYFTFHMKTQDSFWFSESLVDAIADSPGVFRDVLDSLKNDPSGPQIDIPNELVKYLGERGSLVSDCNLPVTTKSERLLVAIEVTDAEAVARAVDKAFRTDPNARKLDVNGHVIWEIIQDSEADITAVKIEGVDLEPIAAEKEEKDGKLPNSAITVVHGHLVVGTHLDLVKRILKTPDASEILAAAADFSVVDHALAQLGAGNDSSHMFSRTDEEYRVTYEMIRQGRMPQSESILGKVLNRLLGPEEEGAVRAQQIDGKEMPDFDAVRRYLGPAGSFVRSLDEGWMMTGCVLTKAHAAK